MQFDHKRIFWGLGGRRLALPAASAVAIITMALAVSGSAMASLGTPVTVWYDSVCRLRGKKPRNVAMNSKLTAYPPFLQPVTALAQDMARQNCARQGGRMTSFRVTKIEEGD